MSATALTWVVVAATLVVLALRRPAYAVAFYIMTFFAAPHLWWWGDNIPSARYSLWAGVLLLALVVFHSAGATEDDKHRFSMVHKVALAMALNATFVHLFLSSNIAISADTYLELLKYILLTFLIWAAIRTRQDFTLVLLSIAIGGAYMGWEVTINERGDFTGSRLEGVGAPSANTSNGLACVMLTILPLIGSLFVDHRKWVKLVVVIAAPLTLNVVLLCNSRGAFLGLIAAGLTFLLLARGAARKKALRALALGSVALYVLLGDPQIFERFMTTFVGSEERDNSAAGRLQYWQAGLAMMADYPLGAGGGAFKYVFGRGYARELTGRDEDRSVHNGFLTEGTDWGFQGLFLKLLFIGAAIFAAYRTTIRCRTDERVEDSIVGISVICAMVAFLITAIFGSYLNNEWVFWTVALLLRYSELYAVAEPSVVTASVPAEGVLGDTHGRPAVAEAS